MLRIRLSRVGAKRQPSYRVVVADVDARRDGRVVERLGFYNPRTEPESYRIDENRALYWLSVGAQPSDAVRRLLEKQGTLARLQRLHGGEKLEALVAEYEGVPAPVEDTPAPVEAEPASIPDVPELIDEVKVEDSAAIADVSEEMSEAVEPAVAMAEEAPGSEADAVAEAIAAVTDDEEE